MTAELQFTPEQEDELIFMAYKACLDAREKYSGPLNIWHESFLSIFEIQEMQEKEPENLKLSHIREVSETLAKLGISKAGRMAILHAARDRKNYTYSPKIIRRTKDDLSPWLHRLNKSAKHGDKAEITGLIFLLRYRESWSQCDVKNRQNEVFEQMAYSSVDLSELEPWAFDGQFEFKGAPTIRQDWLEFRRGAIQRGFVDTRCVAALLKDLQYPERPLRFSDFPA